MRKRWYVKFAADRGEPYEISADTPRLAARAFFGRHNAQGWPEGTKILVWSATDYERGRDRHDPYEFYLDEI